MIPISYVRRVVISGAKLVGLKVIPNNKIIILVRRITISKEDFFVPALRQVSKYRTLAMQRVLLSIPNLSEVKYVSSDR